MTLEYSAVRRGIKNDSRCCGPVALSIVCGITPLKAQNALARQGRQRNRGTKPHQLEAAVKALGFEWRELKKHPLSKCKTVRTLEKMLPKRGTFLAVTSGHVLACKDGKVHDWTSGHLHRIQYVVRIDR